MHRGMPRRRGRRRRRRSEAAKRKRLDQSDAARAKDMEALRKRLTPMPLPTRKAPDPPNSLDPSESDGEFKPCKRVRSFFTCNTTRGWRSWTPGTPTLGACENSGPVGTRIREYSTGTSIHQSQGSLCMGTAVWGYQVGTTIHWNQGSQEMRGNQNRHHPIGDWSGAGG